MELTTDEWVILEPLIPRPKDRTTFHRRPTSDGEKASVALCDTTTPTKHKKYIADGYEWALTTTQTSTSTSTATWGGRYYEMCTQA